MLPDDEDTLDEAMTADADRIDRSCPGKKPYRGLGPRRYRLGILDAWGVADWWASDSAFKRTPKARDLPKVRQTEPYAILQLEHLTAQQRFQGQIAPPPHPHA